MSFHQIKQIIYAKNLIEMIETSSLCDNIFLNNKILDKILLLIIIFNSKINGLIYGQNPK